MLFCVTAGKPSIARDEFAVERDGRAGDRAGAERQDVDALARVGDAVAVALEHLHVGEQMMREIDGLRALEMRVAGDDHVAIAARRDRRARAACSRSAAAMASHSSRR